jgi:hypothetical protein
MHTWNGQGPRTMRRRIGLVIAGVAVALMAGVGTGLAATSGPVDSGGVIHGCWTNAAINGSHVFKLQDAGTKCPKGTIAISWNQKGPAGPRGATGATGATGRAGMPGPAGPGFDFTTASGTVGPAIPATGTYFVDVLFNGVNAAPATGLVGQCGVSISVSFPPASVEFNSVFLEPTGVAGVQESVSGILSVTEQAMVGQTPAINCVDTSGNTVSINSVQWYMSPVQTRT